MSPNKHRKDVIDWEGLDWRILEASFFAHIQLRKAAENVLAKHDLGLAHHRAFAFICKYPGITVGELRRILQISNQAIGKVLGVLIKRGYVGQTTDTEDRRIRHLYLKDSGKKIFEATVSNQFAIIEQAIAVAGKRSVSGYIAITESLSGESARAIAVPINSKVSDKLLDPEGKHSRK